MPAVNCRLQPIEPARGGSPSDKGYRMVTWLSFTAQRAGGRTRLGLSTRFTYSEEYERWLVHRTRTVVTGTTLVGGQVGA